MADVAFKVDAVFRVALLLPALPRRWNADVRLRFLQGLSLTMSCVLSYTYIRNSIYILYVYIDMVNVII